MEYFRKKLSYDFDFLEPYIDKKTMQNHYEKNHKGYEEKLNFAIKKSNENLSKYKTIEDLMKNYQEINDKELKISIREFGGGLINHNFLWENIKPNTKLDENSELSKKIVEKWGSIENFKNEFKEECLSLFGSGWVWLVKRNNGELKIIKTFNQDNPWFLKLIPIIGIDLWEHAYYLKHVNDRSKYFEDFWKIIDWDMAVKNSLVVNKK